jgi:hypothetical protein
LQPLGRWYLDELRQYELDDSKKKKEKKIKIYSWDS